MVISGNTAGAVGAAVGAAAGTRATGKAIKSTEVLKASQIATGNSRVSTNNKGLSDAKALAYSMPGAKAESNVNDGEIPKSEKRQLENNLTEDKKSEKAKNTAKKAVESSNLKDDLKNVKNNDQKINDKVTQDQAGRDITDPKSDRAEPNRLEQGNSKLHGSSPQDSADFANKNKITGPDLVSPGEKGSETGSTPPAQGPLGAGSGNGTPMPGIGGGGGGGSTPGLGQGNPNGTQPQITPPSSGDSNPGGGDLGTSKPDGAESQNIPPLPEEDPMADVNKAPSSF